MYKEGEAKNREVGTLIRQLHEACSTGNLDFLLTIIYHNKDEALNSICGTPLTSSPTSEHEESWDTLSDFLHIASGHGHSEIVKQLIEFGADVNRMSVQHQTPLSNACENGHVDVVRLLICKGAEVDPSEVNFEQSPIHFACLEGHIDIIELLISKKPSILQKSGQVLLYTAAFEGHLEVVKFLIKRRVNINPPRIQHEIDGVQVMLDSLGSPLYGACSGKQTAVAQYLIENGALVTVKIVETFWEFLGEVLLRYTKDAKAKRKTTLSFESDPDINMFAACWANKSICSLHKGWFVNLSARLVSIDLAHNNLEELPEELFNILPVLEELDVSHNKLIFLPEINPTDSFTSLEKLFVQKNQLTYIPSSLFQIKTLKKVNLSYNKITSLEDDENSDMYVSWRCPSLRVLKLNNNCLSSLPNGIQSASGLVKLFLNNNYIYGFPMPWKCPLETLDLSHNRLTVFNYNVEMVWANSLRYLNLSYNSLDCISWNICHLNSLMDLDVSHNSIRSLPAERSWTCFSLHKLNLSYNKLSAKMLSEGAQSNTLRQRLFKSPSQDDRQEFKTDSELPVDLFAPTLETLFLNNNYLQVVPLSVCELRSLIELDLSNNVDLKTLPPQLGNLRDCWQLRLTNLNLTGLPKHVRPGGIGVRPKDTLAFLRATLRKSVPYYRMKLMVVGIQGYGKTTLLAALKGQNLPKNISTVGIVIDEWNVQLGSSSWFPLSRLMSQSTPPSITFSTWDLAGQSVYYAAHQMFLSTSTLYLGVWNVTLGEDGIESLRQWLLNIKARAQYSDVLIVGTHVDMLPKKNRETRMDKLKQIVMNKFADSKGFPKIVGNIVVSATTGENIQELREMIYSKAMKTREQGENVIGKQVPLSYIQLQESVMREAERRRATGEPPILLEEEILDLANKNKDNDILDHEELTLATRFLHENGVLLHYNDQLRGLNNLYFIDPSWVCDLIANIVTVRERNPFIKEGIMWKSNVALVLKDPRFPPQFISQYLQLMERFEIALGLDDDRLLIPSMLPPDSPGMQLDKLYRLGGISRPRAKTAKYSRPATDHDNGSAAESKSLPRFRPGHKEKIKFSAAIEDDLEEDGLPKGPVDAVRRNYQMAYIPSGFWSRLITRLMVSLQRWRSSEGIEEERFSMIYWRKGIGVVYEGGHFIVQSYRELIPLHAGRNRFEELEGVSIEIWSGLRDFSVMGFIVDQVDALISEWYPGLDDTDNFGYPLVRRLIPCPQCNILFARRGSILRRSCSLEFPTEHCGTQPVRPYNFTLPTCAAAALNFATINCPYHPETVVSLDELIPDLLMTDLPRNLLVEKSEFSHKTDASSRLGGGGAGEVFRGVMDDMEIAVKTFHSTRTTRYLLDSGLGGASTDGSSTGSISGPSFRGRRSEGSSMRRAGVFRGECSPQEDNMEDELEKTKVVRAFWDLRQEVAVLCHLQHPCVVKLLGVCLHPLCFILEIAPQGSLANVLEDFTLGREKEKKGINPVKYETKDSVLGRALTYKMAYQVISALWYLHDSDIIYRDLKADNILVWSLDEADLVNVKLSDYGISCFATPQGVAGDEGTPGYQAPEIRPGIGYDEKVDIFSFAIFLYELISGVRPFRDSRSAVDIKKAIRRNVRPSLEDQEVDSQLPRLESVMVSSWSELPERRPSAEQTMRDMEEPEFLCHYRIMPKPEEGVLEKITSAYGLVHSGTGSGPSDSQSPSSPISLNSYVLLWSRERDRRQYSMLNCDTGVFFYKDESCPGHRVLCMVRVGSRTWLGTEGCTIEVFGKRSWRLPSTLCSFIVKAPVLALLTQEAKPSKDIKNETKVDRVYAALANGTLIIFTHKSVATSSYTHDDVKRFYDESDDVLAQEMDQWKEIQVINLGQSSNPVKSMVLTKNNEELWVSCGNQIIVMNTHTLSIIKEIPVYSSQRAHVRKMVACDDRVWSIDRRSTKILQWDVQTHHLTHVFDLEVDNPVMKSVCKPFCDTEGVDIGEEDAKRQGDTVPRMWRNRAETNRPPPPYPGDENTAAKTLVDRAIGGDTRLSRSGALKSRSSSPLPVNPAGVPSIVVDKPAKMDPEESPPMGLNAEGDSEPGSSSAETGSQPGVTEATDTDAQAKNVYPADEESLRKEIPQEDDANNTLGTSVDSGCFSESSMKSVDLKALNEALVIPSDTKTIPEEENKDSENNNEKEAAFEVVNRTEIVVEAAKERRENNASLSIEAASMSSLTANPKSISRGPSLMRSRKRKSLRNDGAQASSRREPSRPRLHVMTGSVNKVMTVLHTGGTLWVGRGKGDVIVINVDAASNTYFYGEVIAQLKCDNFLHFASGQVDEIIQSGNNKIVCLRRLEPVRLRNQEATNQSGRQFPGHQDPSTERYQLIVWEAWGRREFESFKSYLDRFNDLVDQ